MEKIKLLDREIVVATKKEVTDLRFYHNMYEKGMIDYDNSECEHSRRYTELKNKLLNL